MVKSRKRNRYFFKFKDAGQKRTQNNDWEIDDGTVSGMIYVENVCQLINNSFKNTSFAQEMFCDRSKEHFFHVLSDVGYHFNTFVFEFQRVYVSLLPLCQYHPCFH